MFEVLADEPGTIRHEIRRQTLKRRRQCLLHSAIAAGLISVFCGTLPPATAQEAQSPPPGPAAEPLSLVPEAPQAAGPAAAHSPQPASAPASHPSSAGKQLPEQVSAMPAVTQGLDIVQHRSQLIVGRSNIVRSAIADPSIIEVAQYSPNELAVIGLQLGTTTLTIWFDKSREPLIYLVNTIRDPSLDERRRMDFGKLERKLGVLFPNSKVYLIPFSGKIVVKGQAHDAEEATRILEIIRGEAAGALGSDVRPATCTTCSPGCSAGPQQNTAADAGTDAIVNMLEVPGEFQVMLRVRIAELDRSQLRRMGVDLTHLLFEGRRWSSFGGKGKSSASAGIFENREIKAVMNGLTGSGTAKILSEPVLTVLSGHSASFLSGGEFAVPTIVGVEGVGAQQTTFHGFGTSLVVTPVVVDRDLIRMNISPEFSRLNMGNTVNGIPGVDTRRAQTTVQLREGQTIVLAGLISQRTTTETSRIRFLSDLPVLGPKYFSGKRSQQDETELLILVTPEIVRPMDADEVPPVPGHEVTVPNDCELFRCGMTEGTPDPTVYEVPPFGAGHSAGVPVGYHLFEGPHGGAAIAPAAGPSAPPVSPPSQPIPSQPAPAPAPAAAAAGSERLSAVSPTGSTAPPEQQGWAEPHGWTPPPTGSARTPEEQGVVSPPAAPSATPDNSRLDAPPPVSVAPLEQPGLTSPQTASAAVPAWPPTAGPPAAVPSVPTPAAPERLISASPAAASPAPTGPARPADGDVPPFVPADQRLDAPGPIVIGGLIRQTSATTTAKPTPAHGNQANAIPNWTDRPQRRVAPSRTATPPASVSVTTQPHTADGPAIIPAGPATPAAGSATP